jgi:flagellar hook-length control protein FliK
MTTQIVAVQPQSIPDAPVPVSDQPQSSGGFNQLLQKTLNEQQGSADGSKSDGTSDGKAEGPGKKSESPGSLLQADAQTAVSVQGMIPNFSLTVPTVPASAPAAATLLSEGAADAVGSVLSPNGTAPAGNAAMPTGNSPVLPVDAKGTAPAAEIPSPAASTSIPSAPLPQTAAGQQTVPESIPTAGTSAAVSEVLSPQTISSQPAATETPVRKTDKALPNAPAQTEAEPEEAPAGELPENPVPILTNQTASPIEKTEPSDEKAAVSQLSSGKTEQKTDSAAALVPQAQQNPGETGKVVIKVSDAPAPHSAQPVFHQVADAIWDNMKNGRQEFQVDLYPQSLGKVTVKLTSENGLLTVELAASNPKTQSLLLSNSGDIRSILQSSANQQVVVQSQQAQPWYGQQQGGHSNAQQQQQQQQRDGGREQSDQVDVLFSAGDFLSLLQKVKAAV